MIILLQSIQTLMSLLATIIALKADLRKKDDTKQPLGKEKERRLRKRITFFLNFFTI
jgi:hypothetical protein